MRRLLPAAGFLLIATACASAPPAGPTVPDSWDADRAEIQARLRASSDAWNRGSLEEHFAMYADSATFMTGNGPRSGIEPAKEAFSRSYWRGGRPLQRLDFEQLTIRPLDEDAALLTGRFILSGGGRDEMSGWFSLVWVRTPDGWRAVHDHSS